MPLTFNEAVRDDTGQSTYTFTDVDIGAATGNRWVVIGVCGLDGAATVITSVTVDGKAAAALGSVTDSETGSFNISAIYVVFLGAQGGTAADVVVTATATWALCQIGSWTIDEGLANGGAARDVQTDSSSVNLQITTATAEDDYVIGVGMSGGFSPNTTHAWTNLTERDETLGLNWTTSFADTTRSAFGDYVVDMDVSGGNRQNELLITAVFVPEKPVVGTLIHETSVTTGTGNQTLVSVNGKRDFVDTFGLNADADVFDYFISNPDAAEWERGTGHLSSATVLVRDTVIQSSNSDSAVSFTAGTKNITNDLPALEQGGAWDLLETITASNDATIDITGLSSKHFAYRFIWSNYEPASSSTLWIRTSTDGGTGYDATAGDYAHAAHRVSMATSPNHFVSGDDSDTEIQVNTSGGSFGGSTFADMEVTLVNPSGTDNTKFWWSLLNIAASIELANLGSGIRLAAEDVDAVRFLASSGNITSGILKIYGLRA